MPAESQKVCAVVLALSDTPELRACLRSLAAAAYPGLEAVVVRNGPADTGFEAAVRGAYGRRCKVLFTGANLGFAAGSNAGLREAMRSGADYALLLNDDAEVAPDFLEPLLAAAARGGLAGPRIFYFSEPGKIWFSGARFDPAACAFETSGAGGTEAALGDAGAARSDYLTGCCLLLSRKVLETVGLLDESFFLYWEDADICFRARAAGFSCEVVPASRVWHKVSLSTGGEGSPLKTYYKVRGQLLFAARHASPAGRLLAGFARDAAWLLFKSGQGGRFKKAAAYAAAALHYYSGRTGEAPAWLRGEGR